MKILHVVQGYTPVIGGTELLIQKLSERLVQQYGDNVTVFTTNAARNCEVFWLQSEPTLPAGIEKINGVTIRRFPLFNKLGHVRHQLSKFADWSKFPRRDWFRALFNGPLLFNMTAEIANFKGEVIAASSFPFLHMHYALNGGKRSHTPVVLHGALHPTDSWSFERPMIYKAIQQATAYIANSTFEQDYLVKRGIPAQKINTIGVGVDLAQFAKADGSILRQTYGWGKSPVIAFVGQLSKRKGIHLLLAAMPQVWQAYPEAKLLLAGARGTYAEQLEQIIAKLPASTENNRLIMQSNFSESDKANIFAACDVLVFPSQEESFGIVFLEAWACRKAVIGLRAGAIPSIVRDGVDGLLVAPDDTNALGQAICQLLGNPSRRDSMGEAGYHKITEHYTWDIVTRKFRAVYQQAINKSANS